MEREFIFKMKVIVSGDNNTDIEHRRADLFAYFQHVNTASWVEGTQISEFTPMGEVRDEAQRKEQFDRDMDEWRRSEA